MIRLETQYQGEKVCKLFLVSSPRRGTDAEKLRWLFTYILVYKGLEEARKHIFDHEDTGCLKINRMLND